MTNFSSSAAKEKSQLRWLPGLVTLRSYEPAWLTHDVVAGIVLTTMLAPVGIAYAVASGVGAIYGLYATIACLLAYAVFGPSRILVLGPDSSLAAVIIGVVAPLAMGDPNLAIALAGMMALVSGAVLVVAGIARLGFVTELLSKPIRYGYMNGIALTVLISQLPKLFGFKITSAGPLRDLWSIAGAVADGKANWVEFALGAATLAGILLVKRRTRFPGILLAMIAATAVTAFFDLAGARISRCSVRCPAACPRFQFPLFRSTTSSRLSLAVLPSPWCRLPTRASFPELTRSGQARASIPIRRWWGLARPISPRDCFRASRSAAVRPALRSRRPPAPEPS